MNYASRTIAALGIALTAYTFAPTTEAQQKYNQAPKRQHTLNIYSRNGTLIGGFDGKYRNVTHDVNSAVRNANNELEKIRREMWSKPAKPPIKIKINSR